MKSARSLPLLAAFGLLLMASSAAAYVRSQNPSTGQYLYWHSLPMQFNTDSSSTLPGVSAGAFQAAMKASYQTWASVSCSYFKVQDMGLTNNKNGDKNDDLNTNTVPYSWNQSPNALGVTMTYMSGAKIVDADTIYNPNKQWDTSGASNKIDVQAVATHEIGHQLGLNHPNVPDATMYYATGAGNLGPRSLHSDDINGLCAIYPSGSQPPPECTKDSDCATGEKCQNNKCVTASTGTQGYGSPCSANSACKSGLCLKDSQGTTFCSEFCASAACPNGDKCVDVQDTSGKTYKVCYPGSNAWGTLALGKPCSSSVECKDKYCAPVSGKGYLCASACDYNKPASCPSGYTCAKYQSSQGVLGLCVPGATPPPPTKKKIGEGCSRHDDCESNICLNTGSGFVCTIYCQLNTPGACPGGYICVNHSSGKGVCHKGSSQPPPPDKGVLGDPCKNGGECKSTLCVNSTHCTRYCDPNDPRVKCGDKYGCVDAGGGKYICYGAPGTHQEVTDDSGCALARGGSGQAGGERGDAPLPPLLLLLLLPVLMMLRRRR